MKLADFGLAYSGDPNSLIGAYGTKEYIAPELLRGHPFTAAADYYSLGGVFYRLLSNKRFPGIAAP